MIARRVASVNIRWAHNTVTTNGDADEVQLSVISIVGRRVASVTRTYFPPERLEEIVRESEAACERRPEAPDYMPLLEGRGEPADWNAPPADADIHVFDPLVPQLRRVVRETRGAPASRRSGTRNSRPRRRFVATSTGREAAAYRAHRQGRDHRQDARLRAIVMGRPGDARFSRHRSARRCSRRCSSAWAGPRSASTCRPASYEVLLEPSPRGRSRD